MARRIHLKTTLHGGESRLRAPFLAQGDLTEASRRLYSRT
jgi:hypothetical protein